MVLLVQIKLFELFELPEVIELFELCVSYERSLKCLSCLTRIAGQVKLAVIKQVLLVILLLVCTCVAARLTDDNRLICAWER